MSKDTKSDVKATSGGKSKVDRKEKTLYPPLPAVLTDKDKALALSKEQLLAVLNDLPYAQRNKAAGILGYQARDSPKLQQLIAQLRTHPAPRAPVQEAEAGIAELLPPQKKNTAKYYNEDQFALTAAVHSTTSIAVLKDELAGPSKMFSQMAITNIIKQEKNDQALSQLIQKSSPKVYRKFVTGCLSERRSGVLELLFDYAAKQYSLEAATRMLHGCTTTFVTAKLATEAVKNSSGVKWQHVAKSHPKVVLDMIRADFKEITGWKRDEVWTKWRTGRLYRVLPTLILKAKAATQLWAIMDEFPLWVWEGVQPRPEPYSEAVVNANAGKFMRRELPQWAHTYFEHFVDRHPALMLKFLLSNLYTHGEEKSDDGKKTAAKSGRVSGGYSLVFGLKFSTQKKFDGFLMKYLNAVLDRANHKSFYCRELYNNSFEMSAIEMLEGMLTNASVVQGKTIVATLLKFLESVKPGAKPKPAPADDSKSKKGGKKKGGKDEKKAGGRDEKSRRSTNENDSGKADDDKDEVDSHHSDDGSDDHDLEARNDADWELKGANGEPISEWDRWRKAAVQVYSIAINELTKQYEIARNPLLGRAKDVRERALRAARPANLGKANAIHEQIMYIVGQAVNMLNTAHFEPKRELMTLSPYEFSSVSLKAAANRENVVRYLLSKLDRYPVPVARMTLFNAYSKLQTQSLIGAYARKSNVEVTKVSENVKRSIKGAFTYLKVRLTNPAIAGDAKQLTEIQSYIQTVSESFVAIHKTEPMRWTPELIEYLPYLTPAIVTQLFLSYTPAQVQQLARTSTDSLVTLFHRVGRPTIDPAITALLEPDVVAQEVRDILVGFQPLENKAVWKEMTKAADSNNVEERRQAFTALVMACLSNSSNDYLKRAMELVRKKTKNESQENRTAILAIVCAGLQNQVNSSGRQKLMDGKQYDDYMKEYTRCSRLLGLELLPIWAGMLEDALESQDLDLGVSDLKPRTVNKTGLDYSHLGRSHSVLQYFHLISVAAIRRAAAFRPNTHDAALFDFAVEIQWRIAQFRLGERAAAQHFRIDYGCALESRGARTAEPGSSTYRGHYGSTALPRRSRGSDIVPEAISDRFRDCAIVDLPEASEPAFVAAVLKAYTERVVPQFKDALSVAKGGKHCTQLFQPLISVVGKNSITIPSTRAYLDGLLDQVKTAETKDAEGLPIIENDHPVIAAFTELIGLFEPWWKVDILRRYHETLVRTRQARRVFWNWAHALTDCQPARKQDKKFVRDNIVTKALEISPSAIHIKFVWRHLMRYHQNRLDPFINAQKTFRGVFYLPPNTRNVSRTKEVAAAPVAAARGRGGARAVRGGRGGAASRVVKPVASSGKSKRHPSFDAFRAAAPTGKVAEFVKEETEKEKAIADEKKEKGTADFEDYWHLPACYGMHRLLPRQTSALAAQRTATVVNPNRDIPSRVKAMILWTLLPNITYADIVDFVEQQQAIAKKVRELEKSAKEPAAPADEKKDEKKDAKPDKKSDKKGDKKDSKKDTKSDKKAAAPAKDEKAAPAVPVVVKSEEELKAEREARATAKLAALKARKELFPVNLLEACIKGCMCNDEVTAPLSWLLSPKFLGSDQARVAIYSISSFLPYMQPDALTQLLALVLSGKRRQSLKVTAYKEVIRLLERSPTDKHLQMIENEWKRDMLHRDVRIVIINVAVGAFKLPEKRGEAFAWSILESAVRSSNTEIQVALLGPTPSKADLMPAVSGKRRAREEELLFNGEGLVANRRLLDHLESRNLRKVQIPASHCERYAKSIISKLTAPDVDDDVRHLAIFCLADWLSHGIAQEAANNFAKIAADARAAVVLVNPKPQLQAVHNRRFQEAVKLLYKICHVTESNTFNVDNKPVGVLIQSLLDELAKYANPKSGADRDARKVLVSRCVSLMSSIPSDGYRLYFTPEDEKAFINPYKVFAAPKGIFWSNVMSRRNSQLNRFDHSGELSAAESKAYGEELIRYMQELFDGAVTGDLITSNEAIDEARRLITRHVATYRKESFTVQQIVVDRLLKVTNDSYTAAISDSKQSRELDLNRYVGVFREVTLIALNAFPTTIAKCITALRQFIKQTIQCYAVQQWPKHTTQDIVDTVSSLLATILKQFSLQKNSEPLLSLDEYSTAIIRDIFEATAAEASATMPTADSKDAKAAAVVIPTTTQKLIANINHELALALVEKHADYVMLAGVRTAEFISWSITRAASKLNETYTFVRMFELVQNFIEDVQTLEMKRARNFSSEAKPKKSSVGESWTVPARHVLENVFRGTLTTADPIPFTAVKCAEWKACPAVFKTSCIASANEPAVQQLRFQLALRVFQSYPSLLLDTDLGKTIYDFVHDTVLYLTLYPAQRSNIYSGFQSAIQSGLQSGQVLHHDSERTLAKHGGQSWAVFQSLMFGWTRSATDVKLAIQPGQPKATAFFEQFVAPKPSRPALAKLQDSHAYRHLTGRLALDILTGYGTPTSLSEEVKPVEEEEPKVDKKEDGDEDADEEEEKKPKKPKKKPVPEVWNVWRPELSKFVDILSAHSDPIIQHAALSLETRRRA